MTTHKIITEKSIAPLPKTPFMSLSQTHDDFIPDIVDTSQYIHEITGAITLNKDEDTEHQVGVFKIKQVDLLRARSEGEGSWDVLDADADAVNFHRVLFTKAKGGLKSSVQDLIKNQFGRNVPPFGNLLILDKLAIDPAFRGQGLGLVALDAIIRHFQMGVELIAMYPYPLQYIHYENVHACEMNEYLEREIKWSQPTGVKTSLKSDKKKLREYYARLGFVLVPNTDYMIRAPRLWEGR